MSIEYLPHARQIVAEVGEVAGDESRVPMFLDGALQDVNHSGKPDNARLVVQPPMIGIHQAVIGVVHWLVHPDRIVDVNAYRHVQLSAPLKQRIHAIVVGMHAKGLHVLEVSPFPFS
jgi:hypothetical protein